VGRTFALRLRPWSLRLTQKDSAPPPFLSRFFLESTQIRSYPRQLRPEVIGRGIFSWEKLKFDNRGEVVLEK
jgi:hypothetical protein